MIRLLFIFLTGLAVVLPLQLATAQAETRTDLLAPLEIEQPQELGPVTGFPIPRFVSMKSGKAHLRTGPGKRYPIDWVFQRRYLPVEVVDEHGDWRRIRTHDSIVGWLHKTLITGTRTFRVGENTIMLQSSPAADAAPVAALKPGMVGILKRCDERWCRAEVTSEKLGTFKGWIPRGGFWGVQRGETF